jgi:hypothetical protein
MNCEILETLYVRSNGDVVCNDDAGEAVLLGRIRVGLPRWSVSRLLENPFYRLVRERLAHDVVPWPGICERCAFFRPHAAFSDPMAERRIRKLQLEISLSCRLRCPACTNRQQVRVRPPPLQMDLTLAELLLRSLQDEGYAVAEIEYCGQGEPLLHPRFPDFVARVREYFPSAHQRLITSGNFDFGSSIRGARLDEIIVSCDGVFPGSYARYRRGGSVEQATRFLRDARASAAFPALMLVWKYILFEWNDSPQELLAAERLADDIGVEYLLCVYTHSVGKSQRYTLENRLPLPIQGARVVTNATPVHFQSAGASPSRYGPGSPPGAAPLLQPQVGTRLQPRSEYDSLFSFE